MESEKEIILSFLYKRSGKELLKFSDLYLGLSMDLNWFTPDDAKAFINLALKENLLIKDDNQFKPNFNYEKTEVPVGFTPSERILEKKDVDNQNKKEENLLDKMIKLIIENSNLDAVGISKLINTLAKEKNITEETAALLIGKEYNTNFDDFYKEIEDIIFNIN